MSATSHPTQKSDSFQPALVRGGLEARGTGLGARLAKDHAKFLSETIRLAKRLGISVPRRRRPFTSGSCRPSPHLSGTAFDVREA